MNNYANFMDTPLTYGSMFSHRLTVDAIGIILIFLLVFLIAIWDVYHGWSIKREIKREEKQKQDRLMKKYYDRDKLKK